MVSNEAGNPERDSRSNRVQHHGTETGPVRIRLHNSETASFRSPLRDLKEVVDAP